MVQAKVSSHLCSEQSKMAASCARLEDSQVNQSVNPGWLLLVPGLGPLRQRYRDWGLTEADCCLFERF